MFESLKLPAGMGFAVRRALMSLYVMLLAVPSLWSSVRPRIPASVAPKPLAVSAFAGTTLNLPVNAHTLMISPNGSVRTVACGVTVVSN